jgi:hypothetical protein
MRVLQYCTPISIEVGMSDRRRKFRWHYIALYGGFSDAYVDMLMRKNFEDKCVCLCTEDYRLVECYCLITQMRTVTGRGAMDQGEYYVPADIVVFDSLNNLGVEAVLRARSGGTVELGMKNVRFSFSLKIESME